MDYAELSSEECVLIAIEFVLRGAKVPQQLEERIDPDLMQDIRNPESNHEHTKRIKSGA